jgi:hypothetical protein
VLGEGFSKMHPALIGAALISNAIDDATVLLARAIIEASCEPEPHSHPVGMLRMR